MQYKSIREFYDKHASSELRSRLEKADKSDILGSNYPYAKMLKKKVFQKQFDALQIQLVRMQNDLRKNGQRIVVVFEGRDAAGKGGSIKRLNLNLNPRFARVVALSKPSENERSQWYFQRYINHFPHAGELVSFDRSWYNRGVIEPVFNFCTHNERDLFFKQVPNFEKMITNDNIILIKFWLAVSRPEQLRRFLDRETDPLKQWKLSPIDLAGLSKWKEYTEAIDLMLSKTDTPYAPWTVLRSDDKKRVRLEVIKHVLNKYDYEGKDNSLLSIDEDLLIKRT